LQKLKVIAKEAEMGQDNHSTSRRKWKQLSERERYKIEILAKTKMKPTEIAAELGRDRRTIEREIARGSVIQRDSQWRDKEKYSPDAAIGEIKAKGLKFDVTLCTKTVYNMIDRGDFLNLTNKDLPVKKRGKKRSERYAARR
jgi:IS30 family transposase